MPTYYVSNTGNDTTGDGSIDNHYATINKAITAAVNGDVIEVGPGTYTGNFDVNKVVLLMELMRKNREIRMLVVLKVFY